jgi:hypothetical protein
MRENGCMMPRQPTHSAEASSSRAGLPTPDVTVARLEQEQGHASAPLVHFDEAQAGMRCGKSFKTTTPHSTMR